MIDLRPFRDLGVTNNGQLTARHHFCFARYQHPERMSWGALRVLNHNVLALGTEFPPQPHDNVEMLQWVRTGVIGHVGSFGEKHRTVAGEVEIISSGAGITHAVINRANRMTEFLDIRITADVLGGIPTRRTVVFPKKRVPGQLVILASGFAEDRDAVPLRASARVAAARLAFGTTIHYPVRPDRHLYVVPATGILDINGVTVGQRDGAAIHQEPFIRITARRAAEMILIDTR